MNMVDMQLNEVMVLVIVASLVTGFACAVLGYLKGRQDERCDEVVPLKEDLKGHMQKELEYYKGVLQAQRECDKMRMELGDWKTQCCLCAKRHSIIPIFEQKPKDGDNCNGK